jgi:hypothetical protein
MESMAEVIAKAPRATTKSEFPQIAKTTASEEATLATTALQIMFRFFTKPSFFCQGEFFLANGLKGLAKLLHHF